jgi:hypothetical protein
MWLLIGFRRVYNCCNSMFTAILEAYFAKVPFIDGFELKRKPMGCKKQFLNRVALTVLFLLNKYLLRLRYKLKQGECVMKQGEKHTRCYCS